MVKIFKKKNLNKKSQIADIIVFFIVIFSVGVSILLVKHILNEFYSEFNAQGLNTSKSTEVQATVEAAYGGFDYAIVVLAIVMIIFLMVTSFMIPTHPIFVVINIFGIFILVLMGMVMTNVYGEMVVGEDALLYDEADDFPKMNFIISYLPYFGAIIIFITSVIMFSRGYQGG